MIGEIVKFIEFFKKLLDGRTARRKEIFINFAEPAWCSFLKVHEDYKSSLVRYRELVGQAELRIDDLIREIRDDSVLSDDLRSDLIAIVCSGSTNFGDKSEELFGFERAVRSYFWVFREPMDVTPGPMFNTRRTSLIEYLSRRGEKTDRKKAALLMSKGIEDLQREYRRVAKTYFNLKGALLS